MNRNEPAAPPQPAPAACASRPPRDANDPSGTFAAIAAVGATFAGFVSWGRNPELLPTAVTVGFVFFAALLALWALHVVYRLAIAFGKIAIPVALVLAIGCALDMRWAEQSVRWLAKAGERGVALAERGWTALDARMVEGGR